ncbi:MAG: 30S ribosomal protein S12 methylthiotransferase RimO [Fibromonadaceae bacterium]|jgi:ribosomal protein S12 methylthiotransferase|nr:30S ribosomal protein S12 methylthiotransferase RimO [Fibromonadaceae bacterium]
MKAFSLSLGCVKNQVDAERATAELMLANFKLTENPKESDIILINTCGFIEAAKEESIDTILSTLKNKKAKQKAIVYGCLSQRYGKELAKEIPEVDFWLGNYKNGMLLESLGYEALAKQCKAAPPRRFKNAEFPHHAYLKVAEGCNRACSFCAIPAIRGKQVSRNIESLVEEAKQLEENGVLELSLIAQDLSSYGIELYKKASLETLLEALLKNTKIPWLRLMYLYPEHITDSLLNLIAKEPRICKYADMPIQHASDKMLKLMQRKYNAKTLRSLLCKMRETVPNITLRTTVLLGFPGETHSDFEELMQLAEEIRFEHLGGFIWSPEEGTPALKLKEERIPEKTARLRLNALIEMQEEISREKNEALIGQILDVILDSAADESEFHFYGRTQGNALESDNIVRILKGKGNIGSIRKAKITNAYAHELDGVLC